MFRKFPFRFQAAETRRVTSVESLGLVSALLLLLAFGRWSVFAYPEPQRSSATPFNILEPSAFLRPTGGGAWMQLQMEGPSSACCELHADEAATDRAALEITPTGTQMAECSGVQLSSATMRLVVASPNLPDTCQASTQNGFDFLDCPRLP